MRQDSPEPKDYIVTETTRLSITTGTGPSPRPKRRHPLVKLLIGGIAGLGGIASIFTIVQHFT